MPGSWYRHPAVVWRGGGDALLAGADGPEAGSGCDCHSVRSWMNCGSAEVGCFLRGGYKLQRLWWPCRAQQWLP